jgi:hypothetical protein
LSTDGAAVLSWMRTNTEDSAMLWISPDVSAADAGIGGWATVISERTANVLPSGDALPDTGSETLPAEAYYLLLSSAETSGIPEGFQSVYTNPTYTLYGRTNLASDGD